MPAKTSSNGLAVSASGGSSPRARSIPVFLEFQPRKVAGYANAIFAIG